MTILFLILIVLAAVVLGFIILVQAPKGGGLAGNIGGVGNQLMGVQQTTDVLEKGTWVFASVIGILCICSTLFIGAGKSKSAESLLNKVNTSGAPAKAPVAPAAKPGDSTKP
ncbi:MAG: preprotein translocase subunit SecG [Bacteroidetes bacterium]|nr:MAG: preprotein translocase subunit SecG [Bacteroidota bacterium]